MTGVIAERERATHWASTSMTYAFSPGNSVAVARMRITRGGCSLQVAGEPKRTTADAPLALFFRAYGEANKSASEECGRVTEPSVNTACRRGNLDMRGANGAMNCGELGEGMSVLTPGEIPMGASQEARLAR